jgi:hypothetical protein
VGRSVCEMGFCAGGTDWPNPEPTVITKLLINTAIGELKSEEMLARCRIFKPRG